jgi:hypothetical protein
VWILLTLEGGLRRRGDGEAPNDIDIRDIQVYILTWEVAERRLLDISWVSGNIFINRQQYGLFSDMGLDTGRRWASLICCFEERALAGA